MTVDDDLILRLAKLSRLELNAQRRDQLRNDLNGILAMVEKLEELDLEGVEPLRYVTEVENVLRPDAVGEHLDRDRALHNAPDAEVEEGFFRVPRVI